MRSSSNTYTNKNHNHRPTKHLWMGTSMYSGIYNRHGHWALVMGTGMYTGNCAGINLNTQMGTNMGTGTRHGHVLPRACAGHGYVQVQTWAFVWVWAWAWAPPIHTILTSSPPINTLIVSNKKQGRKLTQLICSVLS